MHGICIRLHQESMNKSWFDILFFVLFFLYCTSSLLVYSIKQFTLRYIIPPLSNVNNKKIHIFLPIPSTGNDYRETCSDRGKYIVSRCHCNKRFFGNRCQFENECEDDDDCGFYGKCIDIGATSFPKKQCYCQQGRFGPKCSKGELSFRFLWWDHRGLFFI